MAHKNTHSTQCKLTCEFNFRKLGHVASAVEPLQFGYLIRQVLLVIWSGIHDAPRRPGRAKAPNYIPQMSITAQCRRCKSVSSTDSNPIAGFEILGIYQNDFVVVHVWLSNRLQHELHAKEGILSASSSLAQTEHSNRCHARVCPASGFSNE